MNHQGTEAEPTTFRPLAGYTRFVHSAKLLLALVAVVLMGIVLFYPALKKEPAGVRISFTGTTEKPPPSTTMTNARFLGLDKDNQLYSVFAKEVLEVSENQVDLREPSGELFTKSSQQLSVKAKTGVFYKKERMLHLKGNITLFNTEGYTLTTETISVDIANNSAATATEVFGEGPAGKLKAYGGAMADSENQQIVFLGPVFVTLNMDGKNSKEPKK